MRQHENNDSLYMKSSIRQLINILDYARGLLEGRSPGIRSGERERRTVWVQFVWTPGL
jgi:hypothetical protein